MGLMSMLFLAHSPCPVRRSGWLRKLRRKVGAQQEAGAEAQQEAGAGAQAGPDAQQEAGWVGGGEACSMCHQMMRFQQVGWGSVGVRMAREGEQAEGGGGGRLHTTPSVFLAGRSSPLVATLPWTWGAWMCSAAAVGHSIGWLRRQVLTFCFLWLCILLALLQHACRNAVYLCLHWDRCSIEGFDAAVLCVVYA